MLPPVPGPRRRCSELVLAHERAAAAGPRGLLGRGEAGQGDDFDGILAGTVSFAGVVELGPGPTLAFVSVVLRQGPPERVPSLGPGSAAPGWLEAEGRQRRLGLLELRQRRRHPAVVRMA